MKRKKIFVVPKNDLEAVEIINLLRENNEEVLISSQAWGASWEALEPSIVNAIQGNGFTFVIRWFLRLIGVIRVYGVELAGKTRFSGRNIDHHKWGDGREVQELSSIEQVAQMLNVELNRYQSWVAINDKHWIPGLKNAGVPQGIIDTIRLSDRTAQGVTPDQEAQAVRDIQNAERRDGFVLVNCPEGITSAHSDRLFGDYSELLKVSSGKVIYLGPRHQEIHSHIKSLGLGHERDWVGGADDNGYAGFLNMGAIEEIKKFFWAG